MAYAISGRTGRAGDGASEPPRQVQGAGPLTLAEHDRVLRAIARRDPDRAAEAMTEHLRRSLERRRDRRSPDD